MSPTLTGPGLQREALLPHLSHRWNEPVLWRAEQTLGSKHAGGRARRRASSRSGAPLHFEGIGQVVKGWQGGERGGVQGQGGDSQEKVGVLRISGECAWPCITCFCPGCDGRHVMKPAVSTGPWGGASGAILDPLLQTSFLAAVLGFLTWCVPTGLARPGISARS